MGAGQRLGLIAVAVAVAVAAFVVLRPADDDDESAGDQPSAQTTPSQDSGGQAAPPPPEPQVEQVEIADGQVRGGERRIRVARGDAVRIDVRSDAPDELHLHGYDITRPVRPGRPARFRLKANIEGIFELEAHDLGHLVVAELVVEP